MWRAALLLLLAFAGAAGAQTYPSKPIKLVVGSGPGGPPDLIARILAEQLSVQLGQPFIVDNRVGAGGNIAGDAVAKAEPDGYTLMLGLATQFVANEFIFKTMPYDSKKDFAPISRVGDVVFMFGAHKDFGVSSLAEAIAKAKAVPGKINYGVGGSKNLPHFSAERLKQMAGIDLTHIAYRTAPQALQDFLRGDTMIYIGNPGEFAPHVASGMVKPLAVTSLKRLSNWPDVPTVAETLPGFATVSWLGLFAPRGTPQAIIDRLAKESAEAKKNAGLIRRYADMNLDIVQDTPADFARFINEDRMQWEKTIKATGIEPE
jgi:tripartite-type tricarboxylate transporter receptor subunit TctC